MKFPISRDPHKGGTNQIPEPLPTIDELFPISRDPHKGGTDSDRPGAHLAVRMAVSNF